MDSVAVTVPLRPPTKKMKKRKELDALAPAHAVSRRSSGKRSSQELLSDSSDDRSEYWNISTRTGRKCRGKRSRTCPGFLKACAAFLACVSVLATASLIWLFIDVRQQLTALRTELDQVIAGNEGVPDALQKCHSLSRDLQNNQTIIFSHLSDLKMQINNFTQQVVGIQHGLHQVQEWFQAAPELANVPKHLNALSSSVATFGSQIRDLGATINTLKETNSKVQDIQSTMQQNITNLKNTVLELSNVTQRPQMITTNETKVKTDELNATILHLSNTLGHVNETLSTNIKWIGEDQKKDHTILVSLQERTQDVSAKLMSLQSQCAKVSEQTIIQGFIHNITKEVSELNATNTDLSSKLKQLEQSYGILKNSTSTLLAAISDIQNQEQAMKGKSKTAGELDKFEPLEANGGVTTEVYHTISETNEVLQNKYTTSKPRRSNKN